MIKYSIIVPVYNVESTIKRCLNSIFLQNTNQLEIIIIDDGSTDNSLNICKNYAKNDSRVIIITQKNSGPSVARNNGIKSANGEFIVFVDADDYLSFDFFEVIDRQLDSNVDMLKFNIKYHGNRVEENIFNTNSFQDINGEKALEMFVDSNKIFATPWMYVYRKDLFIKNNLFFSENHIHEDYGLIPCLIMKSKLIKGIDYIGYNYVYSVGSLSTNQSYKEVVRRAFDMLVHYDYLYNFSCKNIINSDIKDKFHCYIVDNLLKKVSKLKGNELKVFTEELNRRNVVKMS